MKYAFVASVIAAGPLLGVPTPSTDGRLIGREPGEGATYDLMGTLLTVKIGSIDTAGTFTLVECTVPPNEGIPYHAHLHEDMAYYVIQGELVLQDAVQTRRYPAGSYVYAAKGTFHALRNLGTAPARMLVLYSPGYDEGFFRQMDGTAKLSAEDAAAFDTARRAGRDRGVVLKTPPRPLVAPPRD